MADEVEAIGIGGGGLAFVMGHGVELDAATYQAAYDEIRAADIVPVEQSSGAALVLGGLRTGRKPWSLRHDAPMVETIADYLARRGEHALAVDARVSVLW